MIDIAVGELCANDLGSRVIVTRDGQAIEAILDAFHPYRSGRLEADKKPQILSLKIVTTSSLTEVDFKSLPLDYRIQIERREPLTAANDFDTAVLEEKRKLGTA